MINKNEIKLTQLMFAHEWWSKERGRLHWGNSRVNVNKSVQFVPRYMYRNCQHVLRVNSVESATNFNRIENFIRFSNEWNQMSIETKQSSFNLRTNVKSFHIRLINAIFDLILHWEYFYIDILNFVCHCYWQLTKWSLKFIGFDWHIRKMTHRKKKRRTKD